MVTDAAGNTTARSKLSLIIDNMAPTAGTLSFVNLDDTGSDDSPVDITKDGTFELALAGNADANGTSVVYERSSDGGVTWLATTAAQVALADGSYQYRAVVTDPAGNSSTSNVISVVVDNLAPTAGTLSFVNLDDTGSDDSPVAITTHGRSELALAGNADANGTSVVYERSS